MHVIWSFVLFALLYSVFIHEFPGVPIEIKYIRPSSQPIYRTRRPRKESRCLECQVGIDRAIGRSGADPLFSFCMASMVFFSALDLFYSSITCYTPIADGSVPARKASWYTEGPVRGLVPGLVPPGRCKFLASLAFSFPQLTPLFSVRTMRCEFAD